jgi:uncharacterized membrane protein YphA (DoxX/SURF4 family)
MKTTLSIQPTATNRLTRRQMIRSTALWSLQVLLALLFLFTGGMKLLLPIEVLLAQMTVPLPGLFVRFIGVAECAGALGLILPGLLRLQRRLTPLAACGLILIMIGATVITLVGGQVVPAVFPLVVGLLCATVASARRTGFTAA